MEDQFSQIASLIGDPVRAKILWALMDKRAHTATELAMFADTTPQNISMHLNKLVKAELLSVQSQGRHKYYNYSRTEIPYAIEALANLMPKSSAGKAKPDNEKPIRYCRSCYDHLAGKVGVLVTEALMSRNLIERSDDVYAVSSSGKQWFLDVGVDIEDLKMQKRNFAMPCLDWSERRHHLAGALGAALLGSMLGAGWLRRVEGSRAIMVTGKGKQALLERLKIDLVSG
jgi:DNA-binding transcriptional ArsR family regulator